MFPHVPTHLKDNLGKEAYNPDGLVPRAIRRIKEKYPDVIVITDIALDPYSSMVKYVTIFLLYVNKLLYKYIIMMIGS